MRELIEQHNKEMDEAVIATRCESTHAIDLQKSDRHGEDTFLDVTDSSEKKQQ